jgi:hypothetical protein
MNCFLEFFRWFIRVVFYDHKYWGMVNIHVKQN